MLRTNFQDPSDPRLVTNTLSQFSEKNPVSNKKPEQPKIEEIRNFHLNVPNNSPVEFYIQKRQNDEMEQEPIVLSYQSTGNKPHTTLQTQEISQIQAPLNKSQQTIVNVYAQTKPASPNIMYNQNSKLSDPTKQFSLQQVISIENPYSSKEWKELEQRFPNQLGNSPLMIKNEHEIIPLYFQNLKQKMTPQDILSMNQMEQEIEQKMTRQPNKK